MFFGRGEEEAFFLKAHPELGFWFRLLLEVRGLGRIPEGIGAIWCLSWTLLGPVLEYFSDIRRNALNFAKVLKTHKCPHFLGFRLRLGSVRDAARLRPGRSRTPSGTRPGHALELADVLKTCNCPHFWGLGCLGTDLALVQDLPETRLGFVRGIFCRMYKGYAKVLKTHNIAQLSSL